MTRRKQARQADEKRAWSGVFRAQRAGDWIKEELDREKWPEEAFDPPGGAQPVSVRIEVETVALLDAFAQRFKQSRSDVLLSVIRGGLADAFAALPDDEKHKLAAVVREKCPRAGGFDLPPRLVEVHDDEK